MQTKVLLSIRPEFSDLIFAETKRYEFRRTIFKADKIKTVIVYSSSPIQKVIGEFEIEYIISKSINKLWKETKDLSGINRNYYNNYFQGKNIGHAIKIKSVKKYRKPKCLKNDFNIKYPPQSFIYITNSNSRRKKCSVNTYATLHESNTNSEMTTLTQYPLELPTINRLPSL